MSMNTAMGYIPITPIPGQIRTALPHPWRVYGRDREWHYFSRLSNAVYWAALEKLQ